MDGFTHQNPICGLKIIFEYSNNLKKNLLPSIGAEQVTMRRSHVSG